MKLFSLSFLTFAPWLSWPSFQLLCYQPNAMLLVCLPLIKYQKRHFHFLLADKSTRKYFCTYLSVTYLICERIKNVFFPLSDFKDYLFDGFGRGGKTRHGSISVPETATEKYFYEQIFESIFLLVQSSHFKGFAYGSVTVYDQINPLINSGDSAHLNSCMKKGELILQTKPGSDCLSSTQHRTKVTRWHDLCTHPGIHVNPKLQKLPIPPTQHKRTEEYQSSTPGP